MKAPAGVTGQTDSMDVRDGWQAGGRTRKGEEDDLLVGPLLGGVVVDGDTTGSDVALLLSPGDVAVMERPSASCRERPVSDRRMAGRIGEDKTRGRDTYEKTTSLGNWSPGLRGAILIEEFRGLRERLDMEERMEW